jgi:hypothetical protein
MQCESVNVIIDGKSQINVGCVDEPEKKLGDSGCEP